MKQNLLLFFFLLCIGFNTQIQAQQNSYIQYTVKPGETLSAIAAKYHTSVGDIMRLNGMNQQSILKAGATIKIPKTSASNKPTTVEPTIVAGSLTHTVQKGETLYAISKQYNVPVLTLMDLNHLATADIKVGQVLKIKEESAALQQSGNEQKSTVSSENASVAVQPTPQPSSNNVSTSPTPTTSNSEVVNNNKIPTEGYFAPLFGKDTEGRSLTSKVGQAMTFKTASGWGDKKYYILMNEAPPGSIVKIVSEDNKTIYAKVLWNLGDMKENEGLSFRISNAAAAALGITENTPKFFLTVSYYE